MNYYPLPNDYIKALKIQKSYKLAIVGKDPYPTDPIGIPFCKPDWKSMCDGRCSGLVVLKSLGIDVEKAKNQASPRALFIYLVRKGIIFLNLSYHFLNGPVKRHHLKILEEAYGINHAYFLKSEEIIFCGEAKKIQWVGESYPNSHFVLHHSHFVLHPDMRNKWRSPYDEWWSENALKRKFFKS